MPLCALLGANVISNTGNQISSIAITWYVLDRTGSPLSAGIAAAVGVLPVVLAGSLGGAFVDRFGHKRASVLSDLASTGAAAAIPAMDLLVGFDIRLVLVLIFLGALLDVPGVAARQSLSPELAGLARLPIHRVNAVYSTLQRSTQLIGPLTAGLLIATVGAIGALWVDAASFIVSALLVGFFVPAIQAPQPGRKSYWEDVRAGFALVRDDAVLRTIIVSIAISNFLVSPILAVILPTYGMTVLRDPVALGALLAGFGGGAVVGGLIYGAIGERFSPRRLFVACFLLSGAPFGLLGLTQDLPTAFAVMTLIGLAAGPLNPMIATFVQRRTPPDFRGRVFGGVVAAAWVAIPPGMLIAGLAAESLGIARTLQVVGIAFLLIVLIGSRFAGLRELETGRTSDPARDPV